MTEPAPEPSQVTPLGRAIDRYLRHVAIERGLSTNTVAAYRRDLASYARALDERGVTEPAGIRNDDVTAFVVGLRAVDGVPRTASSVARMLSSVRGFHRFLLDEQVVQTDVAADHTPPKLAGRLPKAISIAQMERVLEAASGDDMLALRDRALLELLYATGARISEAVDLNVDDVIDGDVVRLFGKGNKQRIVPLGELRAARHRRLSRAGAAIALGARHGDAGTVPRRSRAPGVAPERVVDHPGEGGAGTPRHRDLAAHLPALLRHAPARGWRRRARGAGVARAFVGRDHPDLHAGHGRHAAGHVHDGAPARAVIGAPRMGG